MIWQNGWAWLGLGALALPVLIHLLSRHPPRVQPFPTLRFLSASRLTPTQRSALSDVPLLLVRMGIVAAAVAALAQPLLLTSGRTRTAGRTVARAIVVDTSASMQRMTPAGERAVEAARREAKRLAGEVATSVVLQTAGPAHALAGAAAWLKTQPGQREVVVVSDFQVGAIGRQDVLAVPRDIGVQFTAIDTKQTSGPIESVTRAGGTETLARIVLASDRTDVEWRVGRPAADRARAMVLAGPAEQAHADAALRAARLMTTAAAAPDRPVVIVDQQFQRRAVMVEGAKPLDQAWMGDAVWRLSNDTRLASAAVNAQATAAPPGAPFTVLARNDAGDPVAMAAREQVAGQSRLVLLSLTDAGSLVSAALIASAAGSVSAAPPVAELEPATLSSADLQRWSRAASHASPSSAGSRSGESDGRWLWMLALALLALETWMRRSSADARAGQAAT